MKSLSEVEISSLLDIGPNFLFVDSFANTVPGVEGKATFKFDDRHEFLKHHFLSGVVIPGALIMESMLQCMALTIYSMGNWRGAALISNVNSIFVEPLSLNSEVENTTRIQVNSGGRVEGEVVSKSSGKMISKMSCTFYSDYVFRSMKNLAMERDE
jgi:3-hydroxymyristoyl/3-hydroxydecanoyl-(acyl carrier protein) dehydratase